MAGKSACADASQSLSILFFHDTWVLGPGHIATCMDTLPLEWAAPSSLYASIVHQKSRCTSYNRAPDCDRRANEIALAPATQSPSWSIHFANDYSPTHIVTADSAAEIVARLGDATFDFRRDVVVTGVGEPLVPAQEMRLSITRRGLLFSGESAGTSLVLLPQQFYNCPRSSDQNVRIVRANLTSAALLFSGKVELERTCRAAAAALEREQVLRAEAEAERNAVKQSSCWRFTAPVRATVDLFKRTRSKSIGNRASPNYESRSFGSS